MESVFMLMDENRRVLSKGSFVHFFENGNHQFSNLPNQGFIEDLDIYSEEASIITPAGKRFTNVSLYRIYL
jgi:acyl-CoA hydrolase